MVVSPSGEVFMQDVDGASGIKSASHIASVLCNAIEEVGSRNVLQVVMSNLSWKRLDSVIFLSPYFSYWI